jgi:adenine-specific DNA-methyltransferase
MAKSNYENYTKEQLIAELKKLNKRKKYGLVWEEEKTKEKFEADAEDKLPVLTEDKKREIKTDADKPTHILIEGDNYHALSVLNYTHAKSIDVIYIDPPYNTGNNDFKYNDKFVDREDSYRHSKWLSFMSKRLKLAKNLLKQSGVIFISIDDNEIAQLKLLCDDVFSEKNFIIDVIWNSRKSVSSDAIVSLNHNHTLLYVKDIDVLREVTKKSSKFKLPAQEEKFSNPDNDPRGRWVADPFEAAGVRKNLSYAIKNPNTGETYYPVKGRHWAVLEEEYFKLLKDNRIVFGKNGKGKPSRKRFLSDAMEKGLTPKSIWDDVGTTTNGTQELEDILGEKKFNNPKPVSLIRRILELTTDKNSVVLDFMAGSGTTGHAVLEANNDDGGNRQFVLCTNNENNICTEVCYPRVKKVMQGYKNKTGEKVVGLGGNLKYYKTNFVGSEPTHRNKKLLTDKSIEMLCIKENTFDEVRNKKDFFIFKNKEKFTAILFDEMKMIEFKNEIKKLKMPVSVYVFSLEGDDFKEEFENLKNDITLCSIPEAILKVYRRIYGAGQMKSKV